MMNRTSPKAVGYEQVTDSRPWYTKSGRLELYREENEFIAAGENLPVHREPIDSTFYEPNVIVAPRHEALRPDTPDRYGVALDDFSCENRQGRNVVKTWAETKASQHPLAKDGYRFIFHTPKYRHGAHTTPIDSDMIAVLFGPFGDLYRRDKRSPFVGEGYVDMHPSDAKDLGIEDGDYVWIDSDPEDRPFRGWQKDKKNYEFSRLICRARYYPGTPRGVTRMWFNMYAATPGSMEGAKTRPDGLAKNPRTQLPGDVPLRLAPVGDARLAEADLDDRLARPQGDVRPADRQGLPARRPLPDRRAARGDRQDHPGRAGRLRGQGPLAPRRSASARGYENAEMQKYLAGSFVVPEEADAPSMHRCTGDAPMHR
jgi:hypothetical protein